MRGERGASSFRTGTLSARRHKPSRECRRSGRLPSLGKLTIMRCNSSKYCFASKSPRRHSCDVPREVNSTFFGLSWQDRRGKNSQVSRSGAILQSANHDSNFGWPIRNYNRSGLPRCLRWLCLCAAIHEGLLSDIVEVEFSASIDSVSRVCQSRNLIGAVKLTTNHCRENDSPALSCHHMHLGFAQGFRRTFTQARKSSRIARDRI